MPRTVSPPDRRLISNPYARAALACALVAAMTPSARAQVPLTTVRHTLHPELRHARQHRAPQIRRCRQGGRSPKRAAARVTTKQYRTADTGWESTTGGWDSYGSASDERAFRRPPQRHARSRPSGPRFDEQHGAGRSRRSGLRLYRRTVAARAPLADSDRIRLPIQAPTRRRSTTRHVARCRYPGLCLPPFDIEPPARSTAKTPPPTARILIATIAGLSIANERPRSGSAGTTSTRRGATMASPWTTSR